MKEINFKKLTKPYYKQMYNSLDGFVAINSTYDETTVNAKNPFGVGVSDALKYFADLAKKDGFKVKNYDNKVVEAIIGEGEKNITIMAHADVVPAGEGWEQDPFAVVLKHGELHGRGVADDKGPCLSCYYALKALKENNLLGNYQVRFLVGGNEESGSECMIHYFETLKKDAPTYGFSPDSSFPLIYGEKGIFDFSVYKKIPIKGLISIHGGLVSNAVIEKCEVDFELDDGVIPFLLKNYPDAIIHTSDDIVHITFVGVGAHGAVPQFGKNAGMMAIKFIAEYTGNTDFKSLVELYSDVYGKGLNCNSYSVEMGLNSMNVGIVNYSDEKMEMVINFRYVDTCSYKDLVANIVDANNLFSVKIRGQSPLLYYKPTTSLVKTLLKAYQDETKDTKTKPLTTGGGTYAKHAPNVIAFGCEFPHCDYGMHTVNEKIKCSHLETAMRIYARAILYLGNLIENENKI